MIINYLKYCDRFLQATVSGLQNTQPPSVRISAVRAVFGFSEHLKSTGNPQLLQPYISDMIEGLLVIATQFSSEVLALVLETMCIVISVSNHVIAENNHVTYIQVIIATYFYLGM